MYYITLLVKPAFYQYVYDRSPHPISFFYTHVTIFRSLEDVTIDPEGLYYGPCLEPYGP